MFMNKIEGYTCVLKEIGLSDSQDICNIRNDTTIRKFLSNTSDISIQDQEDWIKRNIELNNGYYFKINDIHSKRFLGTISIYNVDKDSAEFGRYICINPIHALEAEFLLITFAFETMKLRRIYCRTADENKSVWKQHLKFGFKDIGYEYFEPKDMNLKVQELTYKNFLEFDYTQILNLVKHFSLH